VTVASDYRQHLIASRIGPLRIAHGRRSVTIIAAANTTIALARCESTERVLYVSVTVQALAALPAVIYFDPAQMIGGPDVANTLQYPVAVGDTFDFILETNEEIHAAVSVAGARLVVRTVEF